MSRITNIHSHTLTSSSSSPSSSSSNIELIQSLVRFNTIYVCAGNLIDFFAFSIYLTLIWNLNPINGGGGGGRNGNDCNRNENIDRKNQWNTILTCAQSIYGASSSNSTSISIFEWKMFDTLLPIYEGKCLIESNGTLSPLVLCDCAKKIK